MEQQQLRLTMVLPHEWCRASESWVDDALADGNGVPESAQTSERRREMTAHILCR